MKATDMRSTAMAILLGLTLAAGGMGATIVHAGTETVRPAMSTEELMRATALDEVFSQFGPTMEASPRDQGVPMPAHMMAAWGEAAREVFETRTMQHDLTRLLEDKFTPEDFDAFTGFFHSEFGERVTGIERSVTTLAPDAQLDARNDGIALAGAAEGSPRAAQIDEMLELVSAEISNAMIRQSMRGMLLGMYVNSAQGDIEVPWDEIDTHLDLIMPGIQADVALTQRAMMFYAYRDLDDADLDRYLAFLRTEPARKFYALAAYAIGEIITRRMETFGETLARKLDRVSV